MQVYHQGINTEFQLCSLACSTLLPSIKHCALVLEPEQNLFSFALTVSSSSRYELTNRFSLFMTNRYFEVQQPIYIHSKTIYNSILGFSNVFGYGN